MKNNNILIASNNFYNLYNFRLSLIKRLAIKNKILLVASGDKYLKYFNKPRINIERIDFESRDYSLLNNLKVLLFFKKIISINKINTVISFTIKPNLFFCILKYFFNYKLILTISGMGDIFLNKSFLNRLTLFFYLIVLNNSDHVFCHNKYDKNFLIKKNAKLQKKIIVISGSGINFSKFKYYPIILKKKISFLLSSRIIREKGVIEYIDAAKKISFLYPGKVEFLIIGNRYKNSKFDKLFMKLIKSSPVKFKNYVSDIRPYIKKATCVVLPSYREGLSKIILESLAIGRPIIATKVPGCIDLVKNNYNGFLVDPMSSRSLFSGIEDFVNTSVSVKKKFSINSRNLSYNFDEEIVINKYISKLS